MRYGSYVRECFCVLNHRKKHASVSISHRLTPIFFFHFLLCACLSGVGSTFPAGSLAAALSSMLLPGASGPWRIRGDATR